MAKITILGCGFGTALAIMWDKYGHNVTAWSKYQEEIDFDKKIFNELINYAISNLKRAKAKHDIIEACYVPNMNFAEIEKLREDLVKRILKYENN